VKSSSPENANLMLKYSMKALGVNCSLAPADLSKILKGKQTMFLGLDVVHPPPGPLKNSPSIAGLVYSVDASPGQFLHYIFLLETAEGRAAREIVPRRGRR
jgi:hypothetical protein